MPEKSVREMNKYERMHYSLAARTFHATLRGAIILGLVAFILGNTLYVYAITHQYINSAFELSESAHTIMEKVVDIEPYAEAVVQAYRNLSDSEREQGGTDAYYRELKKLEDTADYQLIINTLQDFLRESDVNFLYVGMYDEATGSLVYIADADDSVDSECVIGEFARMSETEVHKFLNWDGEGKLYHISNDKEYGWLCTAGVPVRNTDGDIIAFYLADITLNQVVHRALSFLLQYFITMLVVTVLMAYLMTRRIKKTLVNPINEIADAALEYVKDRRNGSENTDHFSKLNITTGDEIENLSLIMADMEQDLKDIEQNLVKVTADKERIGTELSLATRIQADMLPNIFPPFPGRSEFDIFASMDPAKEVGGDFYDFFLIDEDRLGLVMADVSGKGVPAALFMMISKILVQNYTMMGLSPKEVLEAVNHQICANNREDMFVTVWLGILDLKTGKLTAANAGHEFPVLKDSDGSFEIVKDKHGFVIGGMDGMKYKEYELELRPNAKLFLYTDGVPEATDASGALFGTDRMLETLRAAEDKTPTDILTSVKNAVDSFVGEAPQFDDLTMLCLHYKGWEDEQ